MKLPVKLLTASLVLSLMLPSGTWEHPQAVHAAASDLNQADAWARDAIQRANEWGLMVGDANGRFRPHDRITRREMAAILTKGFGMTTEQWAQFYMPFDDVSYDDWASESIALAADAGLMTGDGNGRFRPSAPITREELAMVLVKAAKLPSAGKSNDPGFYLQDESSISPWALDAVAAVTEQGLMQGDSNRSFHPKGLATRQEVAVIGMRLMDRLLTDAVIEDIYGGRITLNGVQLPFDSSLDGLFLENTDFLIGARLTADVKNRKLHRISKLEIPSTTPPEYIGYNGNLLDGHGAVIDGDVLIGTSEHAINLQNLTVQGDLEIRDVQQPITAKRVIVNGRTSITGNGWGGVAFEDSMLGEVEILQPNARVSLTGYSTVQALRIGAEALVTSETTIPTVIVSEGADSLSLDTEMGRLQIDNPNSFVSLIGRLPVEELVLPEGGGGPETYIHHYDQVKNLISRVTYGGSRAGSTRNDDVPTRHDYADDETSLRKTPLWFRPQEGTSIADGVFSTADQWADDEAFTVMLPQNNGQSDDYKPGDRVNVHIGYDMYTHLLTPADLEVLESGPLAVHIWTGIAFDRLKIDSSLAPNGISAQVVHEDALSDATGHTPSDLPLWSDFVYLTTPLRLEADYPSLQLDGSQSRDRTQLRIRWSEPLYFEENGYFRPITTHTFHNGLLTWQGPGRATGVTVENSADGSTWTIHAEGVQVDTTTILIDGQQLFDANGYPAEAGMQVIAQYKDDNNWWIDPTYPYQELQRRTDSLFATDPYGRPDYSRLAEGLTRNDLKRVYFSVVNASVNRADAAIQLLVSHVFRAEELFGQEHSFE